MSVIPAIQHKKLMQLFRDAGAVGESNAKTLDEIGMQMSPNLKAHITRKWVISNGDKYYLPETDK